MIRLMDFIQTPRKFAWGGIDGDDCTTFPASWVLATWGVDPAEGLRGTYTTEAEAHAIVASSGGMVALVGGRLLPIGFDAVGEAQEGDVGVVRSPYVDTLIAAIKYGPPTLALWAVMGVRGPAVKHVMHVAAWGVRT